MASLRKKLKSLELKIARFYKKKKAKVSHYSEYEAPWCHTKKFINTSGIREHCEINGSSRLIFSQQRTPGNADKMMYVCRLEPESPKSDKLMRLHNSQAKHLQSHMYENGDYFMEDILPNRNQSATCRIHSRNIRPNYKKRKPQEDEMYDSSQENDISLNDDCPVSLMDLTEHTYDGCFVKYIPVKEEYGWTYPRYLVDEQSPASWFDIQCWYQKYKIHRDLQPLEKLSDCEAKFLENSFKAYDESIVNSDLWNTGDVMVEGKSYEITNDLADHPRFGIAANQDYLNLLVKPHSSEMWLCRMQFYFCDNSKPHLFQTKSELLVSCMQAFVQSDADFEFLWIADIKKILPEKKAIDEFFSENEKLASVIEKQVETAKAVLYVTEKASILLRHPDTCFLSSLAMSAGLDRCELVILPLDIKPHSVT